MVNQITARRSHLKKMLTTEPEAWMQVERDWFKCEVCGERCWISHEYNGSAKVGRMIFKNSVRIKCTCGHSIVVPKDKVI